MKPINDTRKPLPEGKHYCKCGAKISTQFLQCFKCFNENIRLTTKKYKKNEGFGSVKDATESEDIKF
jgi:ribosomal protein L40E